MNQKLTHSLVGIGTTALVIAALAFSYVVTASQREGTGSSGQQPAISTVGHPVDEIMADCTKCHVPGQDGVPPSHATYRVATCLTCHPAAEASELEQGGAASTGTQSPAGEPTVEAKQTTEGSQPAQAGPVPHPIAAPYVDCVGCHAIGENLSMPQDHAGYTNEACTGCHTGPALEASTEDGFGPSVPHEMSGSYADCETCHGPGNGGLTMPDNHAELTTETCANCHKPAQ